MKISYLPVSFQDAINDTQIEGDVFGVAKRSLTGARREAFLSNPCLNNKDSLMLLLAQADGVVCGKRMYYPTRMMASGEIVNTIGGSNYYVHPDYRKYAIGGALIMHASKKANNFMLSGGCSQDSLKIYEAMKAGIFQFPRLSLPMKPFAHQHYSGVKGLVLSLREIFRNIPHYAKSGKSVHSSIEKSRMFVVKEVKEVPEWAGEMVKNDTRPYKELHDRQWLQWNLDYNFCGDASTGNIQKFLEIYHRGEPIGFALLTERKRNGITIGFVQEWQSADVNLLKESDIYYLSIVHFSKDVSYIKIATVSEAVIDEMKKNGFKDDGMANIVFKDLQKKYEDINDISKWRIRLGYADVIMG
jgi:GNAT superfamily N-acetyltransferase